MKLNLNKFLFSISFALDLAESQITTVSKLHSKRVAFIALQLGATLKLTDQELFDLYAYALLHDNGLIEAYTKSKHKKVGKKLDIDENLRDHCIIGEENIRHFPFITERENIIKYHHERYDGKGFYGVTGDDIPLFSQIIFFANMLDNKFNLDTVTLHTKKEVESYSNDQRDKRFSSQLVDAFLELSNSFSFWGSLEYFYMLNRPDKLLKDFEIEVSLDELYDMMHIFSNIIDAKSRFTAQHSVEIVEKINILLDHYHFDEHHKKKIQIAANLHDIGKLATPVEILEKEGSLNEDEFFEIKKHAFFTFTILEGLDFCSDITSWASQHHEKPDGSGYPFGLDCNNLTIEARLVSCIDFYQALVEDRPYRVAMKHDNAIELMKKSLQGNALDLDIINMIDTVFK